MGGPSDAMVVLASERLGVDEDVVRSTSTPAHGVPGAFFFTRGTRGGGRLLVSGQMETLFAASSVSPEEHVRAFMQGRRS